jgi:putative NADH-flavin reductase
MIVAILGATGRTGRLVVQELLARGHQARVLVRSAVSAPADTCAVVGDARDPAALRSLVDGCDVVISALGPVGGDRRLHREVAPLLIAAMTDAGVSRFIGISGAGIDVPGDCKSRRDRLISSMIRVFGGDAAADKVIEYQSWRDSGLDWTLVRPPRLRGGPSTGWIDHDAHISTKSKTITRADLASFIAGLVDRTAYQRQAPFVATSRQAVR